MILSVFILRKAPATTSMYFVFSQCRARLVMVGDQEIVWSKQSSVLYLFPGSDQCTLTLHPQHCPGLCSAHWSSGAVEQWSSVSWVSISRDPDM